MNTSSFKTELQWIPLLSCFVNDVLASIIYVDLGDLLCFLESEGDLLTATNLSRLPNERNIKVARP